MSCMIFEEAEMCREWSLREYEVARQLTNAGCPLEIPRQPRGQPRFVVKTQPGTLNEIIDLGPYQTGYALELVVADNLPGEFVVEDVHLELPWMITLINWFEDPSDWKSFPDLRCLRPGYGELTDKDLLKLPCKIRRGKVFRSVLVGISSNPIPEEFLSVRRVPAKVILEDFWGEKHSGSIDLMLSQSKAARLARKPVKQPTARQRRSILAEKDPSPEGQGIRTPAEDTPGPAGSARDQSQPLDLALIGSEAKWEIYKRERSTSLQRFLSRQKKEDLSAPVLDPFLARSGAHSVCSRVGIPTPAAYLGA
jgi:hypothetical protein